MALIHPLDQHEAAVLYINMKMSNDFYFEHYTADIKHLNTLVKMTAF